MISPDVVIMTRAELIEREGSAFQRGVDRGKFEAASVGRNAERQDRADGLGPKDEHATRSDSEGGRPSSPTHKRIVAVLEQSHEALDQLLDDMGEDGLCVCQAAKQEAAGALAAARQLLTDMKGDG